MKREKEALIWASSAAGDRGAAKKRTQQIDKQSRNILGKTYKGQIKVLKGDEPLKLPNRQRDPDLQKVITTVFNWFSYIQIEQMILVYW